MKYFVTGATGLIGSHVVDELVRNGDEVIAVTRSASNATHLPTSVTVVEGDITDKETLRAAIAGVDGVFHIAGWASVGPGPRNVATAERINVDGTRNVLELMAEYDIPKGVYTSTVGVHSLDGGRIDESTAYDGPLPSVYLRSKWRAHHEVVAPMVADGLPLVTVLPGAVFGPRDRLVGSIRGLFRDYLQENLPVIPRGTGGPLDYVADTASGQVLAMEHGSTGEEYIVAGESHTFVEIFDVAEELTGIPAPRAVSPRVFSALARVMAVAERVVEPPEPLQPERLRVFAGTNLTVDNSKATSELGIDFRSLEEGLAEYLAWEQDQLGGGR